MAPVSGSAARRAFAAAALALLAASPAAAQRLLTWQDCVSLALQKNPDLRSSREAVSARRADYKGSWNGVLPGATLSNSYTAQSGAADKWTGSLSASVDLFNAGRISNIRAQSSLLAQSRAGLSGISAQLRFNLRQAFAQALFAEQNVTVSRTIRDLRQRGARLVTLRYDSGRESKGNMLRAKAQLAQAEADLKQAYRDLRADQKVLDRQLGLDDFEVVGATGTLEVQDAPPAPSGADEAAYVSRRPDVALQQAVVATAEASLASARSTLFPTLSADYTRGRFGPREFPGSGYNWAGGFTLSLPLFGGGPTSTYYAVQAGKLGLEKARQDLRAARDAAVVDVEQSWSNYAGSVDQVRVQQALLEAARQRNDEADVRYASGLLNYDNWEIIATDRINNERRAVDAELGAAVAQAAWERALGKELGE